MMHLPASVRVYLCASVCDMRKSFDGLHALVTQSMELDAFGGHLFVFGNRRQPNRYWLRSKASWLGPASSVVQWRYQPTLKRGDAPAIRSSIS